MLPSAGLSSKNAMSVLLTRTLVYSWTIMTLSAKFVNPVTSWGHTLKPNDFVATEELTRKQVFEGDENFTDYFKILKEENTYMLVGARNKLFNISYDSLKEDRERSIEWYPLEKDRTGCNIRQPDMADQDKCQNFIRVFGQINNEYIVCGTNAFRPKCQTYVYKEANLPKYEINDINVTEISPGNVSEPEVQIEIQRPGFFSIAEQDGRGNCPFDPDHNSTFVYTDGHLFSATVADVYDTLIMENKTKIRTRQKDSTLLNDPDFVSSFEIDDKIYFLFRETAVEHMNCGKVKFSRVARVCKKDVGMSGNNEGDLEWTSFFKARLNCSIPGDIPFSFNELQSTTGFHPGNYMPTGDNSNRTQMFYGVFNTPENSIHGSAVCAFSLKDIEHKFRGTFKEQKENHFKWQAVKAEEIPFPHPATVCMNDTKDMPTDTRTFISKHSLLDQDVHTAGGEPVLVQTHGRGRFSAVAVDWQVLAADRMYYDVVFVGTTDGKVIKSVNVGRDGKVKTVVIEEIQVLGRHEAVKELRIFKGSEEKIIVVSKEKIVAIPLYRCSRQKLCGDCVALQDPYCSWQGDYCGTHYSRGIQNMATGDGSSCPDGGIRGSMTTLHTPTEQTSTDKKTECPVCTCECNQTTQIQSDALSQGISELDNASRTANDQPVVDRDQPRPPTSMEKPCAPQEAMVRSGDQIYTASTLAVACVVSIVVAALGGFVIGYRVSLCRNHTRDTEQMINYEQNFGSLRKHSNRHSMDTTTPNIYYEPGSKPLHHNQKIQNVLVSNNIAQKNPNLPNGTIENKTIPPSQASKTYL